jgi:hypothetical protein
MILDWANLDRASGEKHISTTVDLVHRRRFLRDAGRHDRRVPSGHAGRQDRRRNHRDLHRNRRGLRRIHRDVPGRLAGRRVCCRNHRGRESPVDLEILRENPRAHRELG